MRQISNGLAIDFADVQAAAERISEHVVRTPSIPSEGVSNQVGCNVIFKAENLQHIGAFKARGAINAVLSLSEQQAKQGVVTHSSGNHGAALARAANLRGIPASIVMPKNASPTKIQAVTAFGVQPIMCEPSTPERDAMTEAVRRDTGAMLVHPFETPAVMAGQGTVALELMEQVDGLDAILVPVGGGGLLAGMLTAVKSLRPEIEVFAVEPEQANDTARSLAAGSIQAPERYDTVADGLRTQIGDLTFPIIQRLVDDLFTVSEQAILSAMRVIAEQVHLVAEPSGAVAFAGLLEHAEQFRGKTVAVVISGGNANFGRCTMGTV